MSHYHRQHPDEPHPFAHELSYESGDEEREESDICECDLELTVEEIDRGKCSACGKVILL